MLKKIPVVCMLLASTHLSAEVIPDNSVGTQVKIEGTDFGITHGLQEGTNLFHSFRDFSIGAEESATFLTEGIDIPGDIRNILARVTGKNPSEIFGSINSDFDADLYLMNPNGIIFGENAFLNVNGSFHATTADYLSLGKDAYFYANLSKESHFISAAPAAFGFLSEEPAPITIEGEYVWLEVPQEKSLSLIGGDITIEDSILFAPSGRINLASVASKGEVEITENNLLINANQKGKITVSYSFDDSYDDEDYSDDSYDDEGDGDDSYDDEDYSDDNYDNDGYSDESYVPGNIDVSNKETLTADAGQVFIRGGKFVLKGGAEIFADTYQYETDGESITGGSTIDIDIDGDIELKDGAKITAENDNLNSQGTYITIKAENLSLFGQSEKLDIDSKDFVESLSMISTDNIEHAADAGNINIEVTNSLNLNPGAILSTAQNQFSGNAGNIDIKARKVILQNGGMIRAESFGENAGNIAIIATDKIFLRNTYQDITDVKGDISVSTSESASGEGGNIDLNTPNLILDAGKISAFSYGSGNAGSVFITANTALLTGKSGIYTEAKNAGGGNVTLNVRDSLRIANDSWIDAAAKGNKPHDKGGNITIRNPANFVFNDSKLLAEAYAGNGGKIDITTLKFDILGDSEIDVSSDFGLNGEFILNSVKLRDDFLTLSVQKLLKDNLSLNRCAGVTIANLSTFLVIGRDVSPTAPNDLKTHPYIPEP